MTEKKQFNTLIVFGIKGDPNLEYPIRIDLKDDEEHVIHLDRKDENDNSETISFKILVKGKYVYVTPQTEGTELNYELADYN